MLTRHQAHMFLDELKKSENETIQHMVAVIEDHVNSLEKDVDKLNSVNIDLLMRIAELERIQRKDIEWKD